MARRSADGLDLELVWPDAPAPVDRAPLPRRVPAGSASGEVGAGSFEHRAASAELSGLEESLPGEPELHATLGALVGSIERLATRVAALEGELGAMRRELTLLRGAAPSGSGPVGDGEVSASGADRARPSRRSRRPAP